ncbi:TldD/PmbA family protein [Spirulina sp. CS-785/01]|uniref:TldD/PmbA family protein n=1 Tax=Spirulina sp. CS-785/01 TaxID=3021716 RepID=UPI00232DBA0B|nr:TldD/PmbA family protein [Spirulina sp. CS-785/01]MDB9311894.1 TldD/PmbA family protein [Spirulina sp. CS-785/01]
MTPQDCLAEQLLDFALQSGADSAEVYQSQSVSRPVFFEANRLKQLESTASEGTALRLWHNHQPGLVVAYGRIDPQELVEKALALSELNPPETIELATPRVIRDLQFGEMAEVGELVKLGRGAIAQIREQYPQVLCSAEFQSEQETTTLTNSQGLHCQYTDMTLSCYLGVEWIRGEDFLGVYEDQEARNKLNLDGLLQDLLNRLQWAQNNTPTPTGRIPILFTQKAATLLWETVADALNGKRVLEKSSPWFDRTPTHQNPVLDSSLTLSQQPQIGPYSCPFDDEGTPTQPLTLIEQGKLSRFYCDRTIARALNTQSTGNGFRPSLGRYPTPELVNLLIEPGDHSLSQLIQSLPQGLIVDQMLGGGADISGDFSINVDLGYRIQNGEIVGRVKDTMVTGNIYTALKQVLALGKECSWQGSCYTPPIIVEGLSIVS